MTTSRIRMGHEKDDPVPPNTFPDFHWVTDHWDELLDRYGEGIVIVYEQKVLGTGKTRKEALVQAEQNLPAQINKINLMVDWIGYHHRIRAIF